MSSQFDTMFSFSTTLLCSRLFLPALFLLGVCASHAGLIAHYKFDETSGTTAADSSGNGNTGTLTNMTGSEWTTGMVGGALDFDGTNDYVEVPSASTSSLSTNFTVAMWVKPASFVGGSSSGGPFLFHRPKTTTGSFETIKVGLRTSSVIDYKINNNGLDSPSSLLTLGSWSHIVALYDGSNQTIFVDGSQVANTARSGVLEASTAPSYIGVQQYNSSTFKQFLFGQVDDFRVYDHALSASEVSALAAGTSTAPEPASVFASLGLLSAAGCGLREWRRRKKKSA